MLALLALLALAHLPLGLLSWLPPLPPSSRTPFRLTFSSLFILLLYFSTRYAGTTTVTSAISYSCFKTCVGMIYASKCFQGCDRP